jgi:inhibitor of cysteine peptidase
VASRKVTTRELKVRVGREFSLELPSNRITGHRWEPHYDQLLIQLSTSIYRRSSENIGSGGIESFTFKPLAKGRTLLRMVYKRPWEKVSANEILYEVIIDESQSQE